MFKKVTAMVMALAMMVCLCACGGNNYTAENTEYVLGFSGPLTGAAAVYDVAVKNAAQMAVEAGLLVHKVFQNFHIHHGGTLP